MLTSSERENLGQQILKRRMLIQPIALTRSTERVTSVKTGTPSTMIVKSNDPVNLIQQTLQRRIAKRDISLAKFYDKGTIVRQGPSDEDPTDKWLRHASNWQVSAAVCVQDSSSTSYCSGVRALFTWALLCNVDPLFARIPVGYDRSSCVADYKTMSFLSFLGYLFFELGLSSITVNGYKCAVINYLRTKYIDASFAHHPFVAQLMKSITIEWRKHHKKSESKALPITIDMLLRVKRNIINMSLPLDHAIWVGMILSIVLLLRDSELCPTKEDHFMREQDVTFLLRPKLPGGANWHCKSSEAHLNSATELLGVSILIRSAKNDQNGDGAKYYFTTVTITATAVFCLATDMFAWAQRARPIKHDPFLTCRTGYSGIPVMLEYRRMLAYCKRAATASGFDPKRFGTHSLRIGGASIMAAAGLPDHYIQTLGRWKSLAFLAYIRMSLGAMMQSMEKIINPGWYTDEHMRLLNSGVSS